MTQGTYLVIDGPDGCGKSTQARLLVEALARNGFDVEHVREPGSTPVGEKLRELLLDPDTGEFEPLSEALLFSAARSELVKNVIRPSLDRGAVVVAERCFTSTLVYQCLASDHAAPLGLLQDVTREAHRLALPNLVALLDISSAVGSDRLPGHGERDRIERRGDDYHERVRQGFATLAEPDSWVVDLLADHGEVRLLDGAQPADDVHALVLAEALAVVERDSR